MASPTQRVLARLKKHLWTAQVVEKWNAFAKPFGRRIDLFGLIDVLAIRPGTILGVQASSGSDVASHIKKAMAEPRLVEWLDAGGKFQIWAWRKLKGSGKRAQWKIRVIDFKLIKTNEGKRQPFHVEIEAPE